MLLVCIGSYLKSVPRYKFVILDTYRPYTLYLREQGYGDPLFFFFGSHRGSARKKKIQVQSMTVLLKM